MCHYMQLYSPCLQLWFINNLIFSPATVCERCWTKQGLHVFPPLFPWHGSSHSRQHWSDLLEMNGLITGSERRRNTVWRGDEWNWGLGLRKSLRQNDGINVCSTAKGAPVAHPFPSFPWHYGYVMASSHALYRLWLSSDSMAAWLTLCSTSYLWDFTRSQKGHFQKPQEPPAPHRKDVMAQSLWRHVTTWL